MKIFHFSDIHYRKNWYENHGMVFKSLLEDIKKIASVKDDKYVFFSGDIVQSGDDSDSYLEFIDIFDKAFNEIGIEKNRRFCVPGNHDISRDVIHKNFIDHKGVIIQEFTEASFNDYISRCTNCFSDKFCNYRVFEELFTDNNFISRNFTGAGFDLGNGVGVYCLNSSVFSSAGLSDSGITIEDKGRLVIETRELNRWVQSNDFKIRILIMHHPVGWYNSWSKFELERILHSNFQMCFTGHSHSQDIYHSDITDSLVCFSSPPLFTAKNENLGYSIINVDLDNGACCSVEYRHLSKNRTFTTGTYFSGNDKGVIDFNISNKKNNDSYYEFVSKRFKEALTTFPSQPQIWVEPKISTHSEVDSANNEKKFVTFDRLIATKNDLIIKAPPQFGLTCLSWRIALEGLEKLDRKFAYIDIQGVKPSAKQIRDALANGSNIDISNTDVVIIVDSFISDDRNCIKVLQYICDTYSNLIIVMETVDVRVGCNIEEQICSNREFESLFLWSMDRSSVRDVVSKYNFEKYIADEDTVVNRIVSDIDVLNMHRTPLNCLTFLKASEVNFSESPVNRTEVLRRVLLALFNGDSVPKYKTFPDMQDCEYVLGFFCQLLLKKGEYCFTREYFIGELSNFCKKMYINLEVDILFNILSFNHILIQTDIGYKFKFTYWIYYFIAQHMHHDEEFSNYVLGSMRYICNPEIIEFYTGVDRRREDAASTIIQDMEICLRVVNEKCGLPPDMNLYQFIKWKPTDDQVEKMKSELREGIQESRFPSVIKDNYADTSYDRTKPYNQAVNEVLNEKNFVTLLILMRSACRALRNSDYINPALKKKLIDKILSGWLQVTQIMWVLLHPLAANGQAVYDGAGFVLVGNFGEGIDQIVRNILVQIPRNIINWYQDDLYSPKMSSLVETTFQDIENDVLKHEMALFMIRKRPVGWNRCIECYIRHIHKNSFYLLDINGLLRHEYQYSFLNQDENLNMSYLIKAVAAKHLGSKAVSKSAIDKISDETLPPKMN